MLADFVVDNNIDLKRTDKSLGILTRKFVQILQKTSNGVLDLKYAADILNVKQKRRIYDITNVLEGIGLIEKKSKNSIQWRGYMRESTSTPEQISKQVKLMEEQLVELKQKETDLDKYCRSLEFNLHCMQTNPQFTYYSYVTREDLIECFGSDLVLTIRNYDFYKSYFTEVPQFEGNLEIQSDSRPIDVKLVLLEPLPPSHSRLISEKTNDLFQSDDDSSMESTNSLRKRRSIDDERKQREETPDTEERNALAKILFNTFDKRFKRDLDKPIDESNESGGLCRLSPPPHYVYVLGKDEGLCDLFEDHL